ncbi:MAG: hypothetical protein FJZ63_06065 [Chlamydiae bacterium]|nr:hypothetical protein [Chlamydiota bacterium]
MTPFLEILYKLSHETGLQLYPDDNKACKLKVGEHAHVQLEIAPDQEHLLLASIIIEIPLGVFRENVLKHALVENNQDYPTHGYLGYIKKLNALGLYESLRLSELTGPKLVQHIASFAQKVDLWREAIASGRPGPYPLAAPPGGPSPFMGMKP